MVPSCPKLFSSKQNSSAGYRYSWLSPFFFFLLWESQAHPLRICLSSKKKKNICVYACIHLGCKWMCAYGYGCVCAMNMPVDAKIQHWMSSSIAFHVSLGDRLSLNAQLSISAGLAASELQASVSLCLPSAGILEVCCHAQVLHRS